MGRESLWGAGEMGGGAAGRANLLGPPCRGRHCKWRDRTARPPRPRVFQTSLCPLPTCPPSLQRVVDLLRLKEALDGGTPLEQVPLHLSLQVGRVGMRALLLPLAPRLAHT